MKVIGSDPVAPHSFLPTVAMDEIVALNYDFIPETTHFLQLEQPEQCVAAMLEFIGNDGELPASRASKNAASARWTIW